jgi:N-acetylglutamate synthase-like GNAT family acetyltransferase
MIIKTRCVLAVHKLTVSVPYYRDVLGMSVDLEPPGWSFLSRGGFAVMLGECLDAPSASAIGDHSYFAYVTVADASALFQEFSARSVEFVKPLTDEPWKMREFGLRTPDGHRILFGEELGASAGARSASELISSRAHLTKDLVIRPATQEDLPAIAACVCEAYVHYIERIGKRPGPMLEDFQETLATAQVQVVENSGHVLGVLVLKVTDEGFYLDNIAVRPSAKGTGVGRVLLEHAQAEAKRQGHSSIFLATHELMHENRALYARLGYEEYDHRVVDGYPRVFLRKSLQ